MTDQNNEDRLRKTSSVSRDDRAMEDRAVTENREMTDADRIELFKMQLFQNVLPDLPKIPGYHVCWLSTTSQNDTILSRERLGYTPITRADIPGWDYDKVSLKTGEYAGLIGLNEMLAYKITDKLYQAYMTHSHHTAPNEQDGKLVADIDQISQQAKSGKSYVQTQEGLDTIKENLSKRAPVFD